MRNGTKRGFAALAAMLAVVMLLAACGSNNKNAGNDAADNGANGEQPLTKVKVQVCGYAIDPAYPGKLITLINKYALRDYDHAFAFSPATGLFKASLTIPILIGGLVAAVGYHDAGTTWVAARALGVSLGGVTGWMGTKVTVNGQELDSRLDLSTGYVAVRDLAAALNSKAVWEQATHTVTLKAADLP